MTEDSLKSSSRCNSMWLSREYLNINFIKSFKPREACFFFFLQKSSKHPQGDKLLDMSLLSLSEYDIRSNFIFLEFTKWFFFPAPFTVYSPVSLSISCILFSLYNWPLDDMNYKSQYEIAFFWPNGRGKKETIAAFISFYSRLVKILCNEVSKSKWTSSNKDCIEKSEVKTDEKHILLLGDFHS